MNKQTAFAEKAVEIWKLDHNVIGVAAGGSWISQEIDEFSDVDLVLVTRDKIGGDRARMMNYAAIAGKLLSGFTGEHVGEPRLLICLYDNPLLHVDIKFVTLDEFRTRVETPVILFERDDQLSATISSTEAKFPYPDFQWIEDRFWTWLHYATVKTGRGEYFEAMDFLGFVRMVVLGPLLHIYEGRLPRGVRKIESSVDKEYLALLRKTIATDNARDLWRAIRSSVALYRSLRGRLFTDAVQFRVETEQRVMAYLEEIGQRS